MDILLIDTEGSIHLRPASIHGILWLQTHFDDSHWEAISSNRVIIPIEDAFLLSEDAMNAVPSSLREAAYGLGAKKYQVALKVVFPSAISGIVASFILAISRAIGETMIVSLAAGGKPALTINPLDAIQTMTAYIVTVSQGETPQGSVEYNSIFAVGLLLFFLTLIMNLVGRFIVTKYAQNYE